VIATGQPAQSTLAELRRDGLLHSDLNVNRIDARLRARMIVTCMPSSGANGYIAHSGNWYAAPVLWRAGDNCTAAACAAELVKQRLLPAILGANDMRTHLADVTIISSDNVLLFENCVSDGSVTITAHGDSPLVTAKNTPLQGALQDRDAGNIATSVRLSPGLLNGVNRRRHLDFYVLAAGFLHFLN